MTCHHLPQLPLRWVYGTAAARLSVTGGIQQRQNSLAGSHQIQNGYCDDIHIISNEKDIGGLVIQLGVDGDGTAAHDADVATLIYRGHGGSAEH